MKVQCSNIFVNDITFYFTDDNEEPHNVQVQVMAVLTTSDADDNDDQGVQQPRNWLPRPHIPPAAPPAAPNLTHMKVSYLFH